MKASKFKTENINISKLRFAASKCKPNLGKLAVQVKA